MLELVVVDGVDTRAEIPHVIEDSTIEGVTVAYVLVVAFVEVSFGVRETRANNPVYFGVIRLEGAESSIESCRIIVRAAVFLKRGDGLRRGREPSGPSAACSGRAPVG